MYASFEQTQILLDKQVFASLIAIFESLNLDDENDCEDGLNILASFLIVLEKGVQNGQPNKFVQILKNERGFDRILSLKDSPDPAISRFASDIFSYCNHTSRTKMSKKKAR